MRTLITGGTGKLGSGIAEGLRDAGWNVFAAGSRDGDVRTARGARALVDAAVAELGGLDVLVNAASGPFAPEPFEEVSEQTLDDTLDVTVKGSFLVTQAAAAHLRPDTRRRGDDRGRRRLPAVGILRGALRREGGAGDVDAGAREGARAGHSRRRRRAWSRRRRGGAGAEAGCERPSSAGSARQATWPTRWSISREPDS